MAGDTVCMAGDTVCMACAGHAALRGSPHPKEHAAVPRHELRSVSPALFSPRFPLSMPGCPPPLQLCAAVLLSGLAVPGSWYIPVSRWKDTREDAKLRRKRAPKGRGSNVEDDDVPQLMDK
eukprot:3555772-Rhodomonas_salina.1